MSTIGVSYSSLITDANIVEKEAFIARLNCKKLPRERRVTGPKVTGRTEREL
jgi:hypothetical protein